MAWTVTQGALSGGGFVQGISISDDGQTMVIIYDGANTWIWNGTTSQWDNLFHQNRLPAAYQAWGHGLTGSGQQVTGMNCATIAVAPSDYTRIYALVRVKLTTTGDVSISRIWKTSDQGASWVDTGMSVGLRTVTPRGLGPAMAVDPVNHDHVLVSDDAGAIWRTTDGFVTMTCLNVPGGALDGVLPSAVTTGATAKGAAILTFGSGTIPAAVSSPTSGYQARLSDVIDSNAIQLSEVVSSTTATTVTVDIPIQGTGVEIGDTIVFGFRAGIAFDRSSAVVGGVTQGVYIGWAYGASGIYQSMDGCATFSAVGAGGPSTSCFLACSKDGVLYVCTYPGTSFPATTPWRWQSGVWSDLGYASSVGNVWNSVATDPNSPGHVCFIQAAGNISMSGDYGATRARSVNLGTDANFNSNSLPRTSTDVPWMGPYVIASGSALHGTIENSMTNAMILFDPVTSGKMWIVEGIGVWSCTPPVNAGSTTTVFPLTGRNKGQNTLIVNQLVKAPGGNLLSAAQDRAGLRLTAPDVEPAGDFGFWETGPLAPIVSGWGIDYAKSDRNFIVLTATGGTYKSANEGLTWSLATNTIGAQAVCACQTPLNFVMFPNSGSPVYTIDGSTFSNCLFSGSTLTSGWGGFFWSRKMVCADLVDQSTYYAYNINANASGGGLWRSTDGGANWTKMSNLITRAGGSVSMSSGAVDFVLTAIAGHQGHLLIGGGSGFNNGFALMWSVDAGATWIAVPGTGISWVACAGKALSSTKYPAVYYAGTCSTDASPSDPGVFAATDFDPLNTGATPTWERCCRAPAGNVDNPKSMTADKDTFGRWYLASGGTGYTFGVSDVVVSDESTVGGGGSYVSPEELAAIRRYWEELEEGRDLSRRKRDEIESLLGRTIEAAYDKALGIEPQAAKAIVAAVPKAALLPAPELVKSRKIATPSIDWNRVAKDIDAVDRILLVLGKQIDRLDDNAKLSAAARVKLDRLRQDEEDIELLMLAL